MQNNFQSHHKMQNNFQRGAPSIKRIRLMRGGGAKIRLEYGGGGSKLFKKLMSSPPPSNGDGTKRDSGPGDRV